MASRLHKKNPPRKTASGLSDGVGAEVPLQGGESAGQALTRILRKGFRMPKFRPALDAPMNLFPVGSGGFKPWTIKLGALSIFFVQPRSGASFSGSIMGWFLRRSGGSISGPGTGLPGSGGMGSLGGTGGSGISGVSGVGIVAIQNNHGAVGKFPSVPENLLSNFASHHLRREADLGGPVNSIPDLSPLRHLATAG